MTTRAPLRVLDAPKAGPLTFGSVCSGMEAASLAWLPLGWKCAFVSEIDKTPCALLAQRFPETPNFGDMTQYKDWPDAAIDVLVGGTPCQDLSVAGKRAGLAGERSGIFRDFVGIANKYKPRYIVWENVPGALSTNEGDDLRAVFDAFTEIGYVCDADICDAQYFGLAQRRRRLFVVCVRLDGLLTQRTPTSERMAAELLLQPLLDTWAGVLQAWCPDRSLSGYASPTEQSAVFATRRMQLLEMALDGSACVKLLAALGASPLPVTAGPRPSVSATPQPCDPPAPDLRTDIGGFPSWTMAAASGRQNTGTSWSDTLAAISNVERGSTTSTLTAATTESTICTFAAQSLSIVRYIIDLRKRSEQSPWSVDCWNLAFLLLTTLEAVTKYAGQAASDLFGEPALRDHWRDHLDQARVLAIDTQRCLGSGRPSGSIFSLPESLRGDSPPRRQAGERTAPTIAARTRGGGGLGTDAECDGALIPELSYALNAHGGAHGRQDAESETFVTHALRADGFDASEDGTGRGTPLVPMAIQAGALRENPDSGPDGVGVQEAIAYTLEARSEVHAVAFSCKDHGADASDLAPTLRAMGHAESHANAGGQLAVAFQTSGNCGAWETGKITGALDTMTDPNSHIVIGFGHAPKSETNPIKALRALRDAVGEEAFSQWGLGVLAGLLPPQVLQPRLYGLGVRRPTEPKRGLVNVTLSRSQVGSSWSVRDLWEAGCEGCPPQRWQPHEQCARELGAHLSGLSQQTSPAKAFMHALWQADEGSRILREALSAVEEVWRSLADENQPAHASWAVRRLTARECEALQGAPLGHTEITMRGKPLADGSRYKMLGNSMAVPVMRWIGERIQLVSALMVSALMENENG